MRTIIASVDDKIHVMMKKNAIKRDMSIKDYLIFLLLQDDIDLKEDAGQCQKS